VNGKPALFTHDEVITLFHEFGHGLHHMLTRIETAGVAGISGVPWDAVELPSQFMENWCWEPDALAFISGHYETGEPLPKELLDKMLAAKNYQAAMFILRQLEFGLFDFRLHAEFSPEQGAKILETLAGLKSRSPLFQANLGPFPARVQPYLRRRLRGGLLQLPVGRRAGGGCLLASKKRGFSTAKPASRSSTTS
jgi:oligopeptidase A